MKQTADKIEGYYNLVSVDWNGTPVDLNGDGFASQHLFSEFISLPVNNGNMYSGQLQAVVLGSGSTGVVGIPLPMQGVSVTHDGRYPTVWMIGDTMHINLSYTIDKSGRLTVESLYRYSVPEDDSRIEMTRMKNGTISFDLQGHMSFESNYTLYDRITEQLVEGIIRFNYERSSE